MKPCASLVGASLGLGVLGLWSLRVRGEPADSAAPTATFPPPRNAAASGTTSPPQDDARASSSAENWDYLMSGEPPLAAKRTPKPVMGGVGVGFGFAFGGESLVTATLSDGTTDELNAGQGVLVTARAFLNPLWVGEVLGFGLGVEWGWKYTAISASNAGLSLTRFPFELMGRFLWRFKDECYLVLAGGLHHESGVRISGSGALGGLEGELDDALGATGEVGVLFSSEHVGIDLTLRYTRLTYTAGSASGDASHVGLFTGIFYTF